MVRAARPALTGRSPWRLPAWPDTTSASMAAAPIAASASPTRTSRPWPRPRRAAPTCRSRTAIPATTRSSRARATCFAAAGIDHAETAQHLCLLRHGRRAARSSRARRVRGPRLAVRRRPVFDDIDIAHAGALGGEDGAVIIAGTGSAALAMVEGERHQCGGWGFLHRRPDVGRDPRPRADPLRRRSDRRAGDGLAADRGGDRLARRQQRRGHGLVLRQRTSCASSTSTAAMARTIRARRAARALLGRTRPGRVRPARHARLLFEYYEKGDPVARELMDLADELHRQLRELVQGARRDQDGRGRRLRRPPVPAAAGALRRLRRRRGKASRSMAPSFSPGSIFRPHELPRQETRHRVQPHHSGPAVRLRGLRRDRRPDQAEADPGALPSLQGRPVRRAARASSACRARSSSDADFQKLGARRRSTEFVEKEYQDKTIIDRFVSIFSYVPHDVSDEASWGDLRSRCATTPRSSAPSISPSRPTSSGRPASTSSKQKYYRRDARVVIEKPLGHDLASSSRRSTTRSAKIFKEDQVYRIDHYLGKETVQNLLALRFANILFEPIWNSAHIDHVQITVAESVGAGTRGYYDESGALRDMIQNHMLQLALPRGDGAAGVRRRQRAARREAQGAALAEADRRRRRGQGHRARPVPRRARPRRASVKSYQDELPDDEEGLAHRDLRRAQGRDRELALGRRAVLPPHRQAPGDPRHARSSSSSATSRTRSSTTPKARRRPTGWSSACSPTRA